MHVILSHCYPFQKFSGLNRQGPSPKADVALIQQCSVPKDKKSENQKEKEKKKIILYHIGMDRWSGNCETLAKTSLPFTNNSS